MSALQRFEPLLCAFFSSFVFHGLSEVVYEKYAIGETCTREVWEEILNAIYKYALLGVVIFLMIRRIIQRAMASQPIVLTITIFLVPLLLEVISVFWFVPLIAGVGLSGG